MLRKKGIDTHIKSGIIIILLMLILINIKRIAGLVIIALNHLDIFKIQNKFHKTSMVLFYSEHRQKRVYLKTQKEKIHLTNKPIKMNCL
jgi:hypothetical protein